MSIKIITDSASDILQDEAKVLGIEVLPLKTIFGEEEYLDGVTISHEEFYDKLVKAEDIPHTSQINPFDYAECFKRNIDKDIIVITLASQVSGCYQSAVIAANDYKNVRVVDSESMSVGEQILVRYALRLIKEGKTADEIVSILNKKKKDIVIIALMNTLEYLKKGGRISSTTAYIGTLFSIKPVIGIKEGIVDVLGNARGSKNGNNLLRKHIEKVGGIDFNMPFSTAYSGNDKTNLLRYIEDSKDLYDMDMKDIPIASMGATIGTHAGPGAYGLAFFKKEQNN